MPTIVLAAIACGALSAVLFLLVLTGSAGAVAFGYLTALPLFVAGLGAALPGVLIATATAATAVAAVAGGLLPALLFLAFSGAPAIVAVRLALRVRRQADGTLSWYPPGRLITDLAVLAVIGMATAAAVTLDQPGGLRGAIEAVLRETLASLEPVVGATPEPAQVSTAVSLLAAVFPAAVAVSWLLMLVFNGTLAQGLLGLVGRQLRPSPPLGELDPPRWLTPVLAALLLAGLALPDQAGYLAANAAVVLAVPFFFTGLAVVHALIRPLRHRTALQVAFYLILVLFGWPVLIVVGLGILEQWIELRRREAVSGTDRENL